MISEKLMTELENEKNRFYRELSVFNNFAISLIVFLF